MNVDGRTRFDDRLAEFGLTHDLARDIRQQGVLLTVRSYLHCPAFT